MVDDVVLYFISSVLSDKELMLAALAETVDEFLSKKDTIADHKTEPVKLKDAGNTK